MNNDQAHFEPSDGQTILYGVDGGSTKKKVIRPHYKELLEDLKMSHNILYRCVVGISIVAAASLILNIILITQMKP